MNPRFPIIASNVRLIEIHVTSYSLEQSLDHEASNDTKSTANVIEFQNRIVKGEKKDKGNYKTLGTTEKIKDSVIKDNVP